MFFKTRQANANIAVIISICCLSAFFTAFLFNCLFNEKLFISHYIGMGFLAVAIVIIALGAKTTPEGDDESSPIEGFPTISIWIPICIVVINSIVHSSISVTGRYFLIQGGMPSFDFSMDAYILHAFLLMVSYVIYCQVVEPLP